jgi:hypothetical protein
MNRLTWFLYRVRGFFPEDMAREMLETKLVQAFQEFFASLGRYQPERFGLELKRVEGGRQLRLEFVPAAAVLEGSPLVSMEFDW